MPRLDPKNILRHATGYLKQHPEEVWRVLRGALGLRVGVPMDALRYLLRELGGGPRAPKEVTVEAVPPGVRVGATINLMGTVLRAVAILYVEELSVVVSEIRLGLRIEGLTLTVLGDTQTPLSGLIQSGALDLTKPGNLVAFMPKRPAALVDAAEDRIAFDLMKIPAVAGNAKVRRALSVATPVLEARALKTKDDHLDLYLHANLAGVPRAVEAARAKPRHESCPCSEPSP